MKKKTLLIAISMIMNAINATPQSWVTQNVNPVNQGFNFISLSVVNSSTVLGIGTRIDNSLDLQYLYCSRTTNGGANWTSRLLDIDWYLTSFQALSADSAWMSTISIAGIYSASNYHASIRKTTDGGQSWVKNNNIPFDSLISYCDFLHFFNSREGVVFGDPYNGPSWEVYCTSNGGLNWSPADSVPTFISGEYVHDNTQYSLGNCIWATSNKGRVFYTYDKGHKWRATKVASFQYPQMFRVAFFNQFDGIAVTYNHETCVSGNIYRTHNGGASWSLLPHTGPVYLAYPAGNIFIVPGSHIIIANGGGNSYYGSSFSADSGATWIAIDATRKYGVVDGKDWNSLWAGQYSNSIGVGGIAKWDGSHLDIKQLITKNDFLVYPNPSTGLINLTFAESSLNSTLYVFNAYGQLLISKNITNESSTTIDLSNCAKGVYYIKVQSLKGLAIRKIVID